MYQDISTFNGLLAFFASEFLIRFLCSRVDLFVIISLTTIPPAFASGISKLFFSYVMLIMQKKSLDDFVVQLS